MNMRKVGRLVQSAVVFGVVVLAGASTALAANVPSCAAVNAICNSTTATECIVDQVQTLPIPANGAFTCTVDRDLLITDTGAIVVTIPDNGLVRTLNLNVTNAGGGTGALTMDLAARISGDATGDARKGATLNILAAGKVTLNGDGTTGARISADSLVNNCATGGKAGNINLETTFVPAGVDVSLIVEADARISTNGVDTNPGAGGSPCEAGDIVIKVPLNGRATIDGIVESAVDTGSTGTGRRADGGPVTIIGGCDLLVTGKVSSRGRDNGADRIHLEAGCTVTITGLVESIGAGHITNPLNLCIPSVRPDKPADSTACVEIWSGGLLRIDGPSGAEVRADNSTGSTIQGRTWVDLFAVGPITIIGTGPGNAPDPTDFVVHANGNGLSSDVGGTIQVRSRDSGVLVNGPALQANAVNVNNGGKGGVVLVEAKLDVNLEASSALLSDGIVEARGNIIGGAPAGGTVNLRSFGTAPATGSILANAGSTVNVTGGTGNGNGHVDLTACGAVEFPPGVILPLTLPAGNKIITTGICGGNPAFPDYVIFPACLCGGPTPPDGDCVKSSIRQILSADGRFPGNAEPDILVKAHLGQSIQQAVDTVSDSNGDGYLIILVVARDNGLLGGVANESVTISRDYPLPFGLLACSVTMIGTAPGHSEATGLIELGANAPQPLKNGAPQPGNIFVMDLHGSESTTAGWQVNGDGRMLRNVNVIGNPGDGAQYIGNNNIQHGGRAENNGGVGISVQGNGNTLTGVDAFDNASHGVQVTGNDNVIDDVDSGDRNKPNGGDGINVTGNGNRLNEVSAFANAGNGIWVKGNTNVVFKGDAGEKSKPNGLDGVHVEGNGNTIQEADAFANGGDGFEVIGSDNLIKNNDAGSNKGDGNGGSGFVVTGGNNALESNRANANVLDGFNISAGANKLKSNQSNQGSQGGTKENLLCEYRFADASTLDQNGNKKDNVNFVGTGSPKTYAAGCFE